MEVEHFSHNHPLIFTEEIISHEADDEETCSACGEAVSGPRFSCIACGFRLHKDCAEAASQLNHPFHRDHCLNLFASSPYDGGSYFCDFCGKNCENFVYHCSCGLDLHIKCAFFSYSIAEKSINVAQLQNNSTDHGEDQPKESVCFVCWKPLSDSSSYLSLDSGFHMHKSCFELPLEINHLSHRQHPLFLQFNGQSLPCKICKTQRRPRGSLVYSCSICEFVLHIGCVWPPPMIEDPSCHQHPFSRCFRPDSFICNACGTWGDCVCYICLTCSIIVHEKCISLPRIIKSIWHHHPISHNYFLVDNECKIWECGVCHEEVKKEYGGYSCSECKFIVHVNCALESTGYYYKIESKKAYENSMLIANTMDPTFVVIKEIKLGDDVINSEIKHFSHPHKLVLISDDDGVPKVKGDHTSRCCDGCSRLINMITPFYGCMQMQCCDFFLHKSCAELPMMKQVWFNIHQLPLKLNPNRIFICDGYCDQQCSGFAYECQESSCNAKCCIRCTEVSLTRTIPGHNHLLPIYRRSDFTAEICEACGDDCSPDRGGKYRCKDCNFNVHITCTLIPQIARHKFDEHLLALTYHQHNHYSEYLCCDICEGERNPNCWFYHCAICDTCAHVDCVLGDHPFIKRGIKIFSERDHPHSLVTVQKVYQYPEICCKCGQPCLDLALECVDTSCNFIIHWRCRHFWFQPLSYISITRNNEY